MEEHLVDSGGIPLAVREFGGSGKGVLLLHGLGRTLVDWSVLAHMLSDSHRVVAFDLRGHGRSGDGHWSWEAAVGDIDTVASALELDEPAIVGHSLGGMLATMWAIAHPGARAVNIDGHGRRAISQYAGIAPDEAERRVAEANERIKASLEALGGALAPPLVESLLAQQRALAVRFGAPQDMFVEAIGRILHQDGGATFLRPSPTGLGARILAEAEAVDMFELYPKVSGRVLVVAGTEPDPGADRGLMAAYRTGLRRDLEQAAATIPHLRVEFVSGGHGLLFEDPTALAAHIRAFLTE